MAVSPDSPVRTLIASETGVTKIFPSPISPLLVAETIASTTSSFLSSATTDTSRVLETADLVVV